MGCQSCSQEGVRVNIYGLELCCGYNRSDYENPKAESLQTDQIPQIGNIIVLWELDKNIALDPQISHIEGNSQGDSAVCCFLNKPSG